MWPRANDESQNENEFRHPLWIKSIVCNNRYFTNFDALCVSGYKHIQSGIWFRPPPPPLHLYHPLKEGTSRNMCVLHCCHLFRPFLRMRWTYCPNMKTTGYMQPWKTTIVLLHDNELSITRVCVRQRAYRKLGLVCVCACVRALPCVFFVDYFS